MGMTWKICVKNKGFDYDAHKNDYMLDATIEASESITDDMVFDRECLGTWMGLTKNDYKELMDYGFKEINRGHIERALKVIEDVVAKVKSMPFEKTGTASVSHKWNEKTEHWDSSFTGTPLNIEILKVVDSVFDREYHFNFPWDESVMSGDFDVGVPDMIEALKCVLDFIDENPNEKIIVFYY